MLKFKKRKALIRSAMNLKKGFTLKQRSSLNEKNNAGINEAIINL
jgi:hypothetical protein